MSNVNPSTSNLRALPPNVWFFSSTVTLKPFLAKWKQQGKVLAVYSSGSVKAQKLLFGYANVGDLTSLFSHYFDTHIGHKREAAAYQHISQQLKIPADEILFLSDIHQELAAAKQAGLQVIGLNRDTELNAEQHPSEYTWLSSFKEVDSVLQK